MSRTGLLYPLELRRQLVGRSFRVVPEPRVQAARDARESQERPMGDEAEELRQLRLEHKCLRSA